MPLFFMCSEINKFKALKLAILRFYPKLGSCLYYSIVAKTFFIVKTLFITHKLAYIHINLYNFYKSSQNKIIIHTHKIITNNHSCA